MSSKTKEKQIKELTEHILGFQESVGNYFSLMKQLNDLRDKKPNPFKDSNEIKHYAYKLKNEIDELWSNKILTSTADSDLNWLYNVSYSFEPSESKTYDALSALAHNTKQFVDLVLSEINKQEQLAGI